MSIRAAGLTDAEDIRRLVMSLAHCYLPNGQAVLPEWFAATLTLAEFSKRLCEAAYANYVYEVAGKLVGYIASKDGCHLYHLFVAGEYQQQGIARRLWQYVLDRSPCTSFTVRSSLNAVPVYRRFGFKNSGPVGEREGILFQPMEYCSDPR